MNFEGKVELCEGLSSNEYKTETGKYKGRRVSTFKFIKNPQLVYTHTHKHMHTHIHSHTTSYHTYTCNK